MKRILFIAPHCYPIRSSESICNSKLAYSLAKAGYRVDVFTCSDESTYPFDQRINSLLQNSENLSVNYVSYRILSRKMNLFSLLKNMIHYLLIFFKSGYYYNGIDAPYQIVSAIKRQIKIEGRMPYDIMITRGFLTDYAGLYMAKKYGIKWIANWNDPYPNERFPEPYGQGYDTKLPYLMQKIIDDMQKYATLHTFPNDRLRKYMLKCFPKVKTNQTYVVHHMAHSELTLKHEPSDSGVFRLVHSGSVNKPRSPKEFLEALSLVIKDADIKIECEFIGGYDDSINDMVKSLKLENIVSFKPSMSYADSLKYLTKADLSLIIEAICEEGIYLPTKFVDALQSSTPVFCVSPVNGTLKDLVEKHHVGYACNNKDVHSIVTTLQRAIADFKNNKIPKIESQKVNCFFDKYIVEQYKDLFD